MCGNVSMRYEANEIEQMFALVFWWANVRLLSVESGFKVTFLHRRLVLLRDLVLLLLVRRAVVLLASSCRVFKSL